MVIDKLLHGLHHTCWLLSACGVRAGCTALPCSHSRLLGQIQYSLVLCRAHVDAHEQVTCGLHRALLKDEACWYILDLFPLMDVQVLETDDVVLCSGDGTCAGTRLY